MQWVIMQYVQCSQFSRQCSEKIRLRMTIHDSPHTFVDRFSTDKLLNFEQINGGGHHPHPLHLGLIARRILERRQKLQQESQSGSA